METVLRDAQNQFMGLLSMLTSTAPRNNEYFTELSIATEEAYFTMNAGMCSSTSICKECSANRDYIHTMMKILGTLETDSSQAPLYSEEFSQYTEKVREIITRIASVISTL
jgi:hypothetical protein